MTSLIVMHLKILEMLRNTGRARGRNTFLWSEEGGDADGAILKSWASVQDFPKR